MNSIIDALAGQWLYDISILSQGWVIWTVLPALIYFAFMLIKWGILTVPVWLPAVIVIGAINRK